MKGYTDFAMGFMGAEAVATKPIGSMKYMDWQKVQKVVDEHPNSVIHAGLMEDWNNTSGLIYAKGKYYDGYVYGSSTWATPIVDVDGEEIECWTNEETKEGHRKPTWWGSGQKLLSEWDYEEDGYDNTQLKVYSVIADKCDYDMYDEFVVVAKDEGSALEMVIGSFDEWQRNSIHVEEVDLTTEHVVLGSFNEG